MLIFASLVGWLTENIVRLIDQGILDNRYHFLPMLKFCLKYIPYKIALIIDRTLGIIFVLDNLYMIIYTLVAKTKPIYRSICYREVCG